MTPAIGVFDSGVGGLTVLRALRKKWPGENFIYLADTARLPYGSKTLSTVHNYVHQNLNFLKRYPLKAVVVACNTASAAIIEEPIQFNQPVFNVVEPGARKAVQMSASQRIGVLGTRATILSQAYVKAILKNAPDAEVFQQACPLFVPLVEEGWVDDPVTNLIVYRYISSVMSHGIDTLILGCTHYPALENAIRKATGSSIQLVDSSLGLIEDLAVVEPKVDGNKGWLTVLCTDFSPRFEETLRMLMPEETVDSIETIDL